MRPGQARGHNADDVIPRRGLAVLTHYGAASPHINLLIAVNTAADTADPSLQNSAVPSVHSEQAGQYWTKTIVNVRGILWEWNHGILCSCKTYDFAPTELLSRLGQLLAGRQRSEAAEYCSAASS